MIKPVIGIGADISSSKGREHAAVYLTYVDAVRRAGAIPLLVPPQEGNLAEVVERLDGILLAGGYDCDPAVYGEEKHTTLSLMDGRRQRNDLALAKIGFERQLPTLGICLGMQLMNVAKGGTLIQDIRSENPAALAHESTPPARSRHDVEVFAGSRLATFVGSGLHNVNSSHHQAIRTLAAGLRITAQASDGIIEAVEEPEHRFYIGVQWHPEDMPGEQSAGDLFDAFAAAARVMAEERRQAATV